MRRLAVLLLVLALAACSAVTPTPGGTLNLAAPCLPPGITPDFFFWPVVGYRTITLHTQDAQDVEGAFVVYGLRDNAVAVVWVGDQLVAVDPSPETEDPDWIDAAFVIVGESGFVLRTTPDSSCRWVRNTSGTRV